MKATCSVDGCDHQIHCRGLCNTHYRGMRKRGELELLPMLSVDERLTVGLIRAPNGCLEWTGATNPAGYGLMRANGKVVLTHRLAWALANGAIPDGLQVLHHCDNPPCCDAETHLFLGTDADNRADMAAKGRGRGPARLYVARLSEVPGM